MTKRSKKDFPNVDDVQLEEDTEILGEEQEGLEEGMTQEKDPGPAITKETLQEAKDVLSTSIDKQVTQMGRATAKKLKECPTEKVLVPKDRLNKDDGYAVVGINGWNFQIQKDTPVVLPAPVVTLLEQGGYYPTRVR